jgi:putative Holliday junction resolvase
MKYLGVDYGRRKIGLAISEGKLAEPWKVIRYKDIKILRDEIKKIATDLETETIVIGISEGEMGEEEKEFSSSLRKTGISVINWDETLTTQEAQRLSQEAGISRKKRKSLEDAYSAALILQDYLDNH